MSNVAPFKDAELLREWEDGYKLVEVKTHRDLKTLSRNGGGCAEYHAFLTDMADPQGEYMFVLINNRQQVGTILFCKRAEFKGGYHPQDQEYREWIRKTYPSGGYCHLNSNSYDYDIRELDWRTRYAIRYAEDNLKRAREEYFRIKELALKHGPLGKDNPMKKEVDEANRRVIACNKKLKEVELSTRVRPGMHLRYKGAELFVLQVTGRGTDYKGTDNRYIDKFLEGLEFIDAGEWVDSH